MTDTGQFPGEGQPENAQAQPEQRPDSPAADGAYAFAGPVDGVEGAHGEHEGDGEDEDLLLPGARGAWGDPQIAPPQPAYAAAASPRRPLHLGPPVPEQSGAVRSLADRGPTTPSSRLGGPSVQPPATESSELAQTGPEPQPMPEEPAPAAPPGPTAAKAPDAAPEVPVDGPPSAGAVGTGVPEPAGEPAVTAEAPDVVAPTAAAPESTGPADAAPATELPPSPEAVESITPEPTGTVEAADADASPAPGPSLPVTEPEAVPAAASEHAVPVEAPEPAAPPEATAAADTPRRRARCRGPGGERSGRPGGSA